VSCKRGRRGVAVHTRRGRRESRVRKKRTHGRTDGRTDGGRRGARRDRTFYSVRAAETLC